MLPECAVAREDGISEQRIELIDSSLANFEVMELRCEHGLDVARLNGILLIINNESQAGKFMSSTRVHCSIP